MKLGKITSFAQKKVQDNKYKYRKALENSNFETNLTRDGIAAFIDRVSNSRFYEFKLETLTDHPIQIYVNNSQPRKVLYISPESIEKLKTEILEW